MKRDDFISRYAIKLLSSVGIALMNIIIQLIIPRVFSVDEYGYYNYNLNVFTSIVVMANLSASNAFVSKYARRCEEIGLIRFYFRFFALVSLLLNVGVIIIIPLPFFSHSFGGQTLITVLLGLECAVITKFLSDVVSLYDAAAISRFPALMQIVLKISMCTFVLIGYIFRFLDLNVFYAGQGVITLLVVIFLVVEFRKDHQMVYENALDKGAKEYIKEFYLYCKPLVIANLISSLVVIIMNYTLMHFSGTVGQAMFGAAWQLNTLVGYVFSPYAELMKREFAICINDKERLVIKFRQSLRMMIWVTSYFSIFIAEFSRVILPMIFGEAYSEAILVTQLIMLYTCFQAWGQVTGAFMLATEQTRINGWITILGQVLTVFGVFLFQIPNFIFENSLGANGIALNYLVTNVLCVLVTVSYLCYQLQISLIKEIINCLAAIGLTFIVAFLIYRGMLLWLNPYDGMKQSAIFVLLGGGVYSLVIGAIAYSMPSIMGITREQINTLGSKFIALIKTKQ